MPRHPKEIATGGAGCAGGCGGVQKFTPFSWTVQVADDYRSIGAVAHEEGDEAALEEYMDKVWLREQLWTGTGGDCDAEGSDLDEEPEPAHKKRRTGERKRKMYREKSYWLGVDLDNALRDFGGLAKFCITPELEENANPALWPHLNVASDCGPDVYCLLNACENHLRINLSRSPDVSHGAHNDVLLSIFDQKWGGFFYLLTVCINVVFLPWGDGRHGRTLRQAADEMKRIYDENDHLFSFYFEALAMEKDMGGADAAEDGQQRLFAAVVNSVRLRLSRSKVGMCRFYQLIVEMQEFLGDWTSFLIGLIVSGINDAWIEKRRRPDAAMPHDAAVEAGPGGRGAELTGSTKKSSVMELRALRITLGINPFEWHGLGPAVVVFFFI